MGGWGRASLNCRLVSANFRSWQQLRERRISCFICLIKSGEISRVHVSWDELKCNIFHQPTGGMEQSQRRVEFRHHFMGIDWTLPAKTVAIDGRNFTVGQRHPTLSGHCCLIFNIVVVVVVVVAGNLVEFIDIFFFFNDRSSRHFTSSVSLSSWTLSIDGPMLATRTGN